MALMKNITYSINYTLPRYSTVEEYKNVLSVEQIEELTNCISKDFVINDVYMKIDAFNGNKSIVDITVGFYKDGTKATLILTKQYEFIPIIDGDNILKQGYEYLKTLDEYKDAIDC